MKRKMKTNRNNYLVYRKKNLTSFSEVSFKDTTVTVDVSGNPISNFEGLPSCPHLTAIKAEHTAIDSFKGATIQPSLLQLSITNTPLAKVRHVTTMALVVFGPSLRSINGRIVLPNVRSTAMKIRPRVLPHLEKGYLLTSIDPLKIMLPSTSEEIIVDLDNHDYLEKEKQIRENNRIIQEMRETLIQLQKEKRAQEMARCDEEKIMEAFVTPSPKRRKCSPKKSPKKTQRNMQTTQQLDDDQQNQQQEEEQQEEEYIQQEENEEVQQNDNQEEEEWVEDQQQGEQDQVFEEENYNFVDDDNQAENNQDDVVVSEEEERNEELANQEIPIDNQNISRNEEEESKEIFNFSEEENIEEEDSPDVAALKAEINQPRPKMPFITDKFSDDDMLMDLGGEAPPEAEPTQEPEQQPEPEQQNQSEQNIENEFMETPNASEIPQSNEEVPQPEAQQEAQQEPEQEIAVEEPVAQEEEQAPQTEEVVPEEPPVAGEEPPVAEEEQPVAEEEQPAAGEEQPVAEEEQPVAGEEPPVAADAVEQQAVEEAVVDEPAPVEDEEFEKSDDENQEQQHQEGTSFEGNTASDILDLGSEVY